jgi:DNA-binding NarL/FixJ family response regulator
VTAVAANPARLLLVDDHATIVDALRGALESAGHEVVGTAGDGEEAVAAAVELQPDVILMDISMPNVDGIAATRRITDAAPAIRVVVLSMHDDPASTRAAIEAGAVAYLSKGTRLSDILDVIEGVRSDDTLSPELARVMLEEAPAQLTPRELEVLRSYAGGARSVGDVSRTLDISTKTVEKHLTSIYGKLDAANQLDAVLAAVERGIINLAPRTAGS